MHILTHIHAYIKNSVLVRVVIAVVKHHDQNQVREERVYLACMSILLFIIEGSQYRNSNRV